MFEGHVKNTCILAGELESVMALSGDVFVLVCVNSFRVAQNNGLLTGGWE